MVLWSGTGIFYNSRNVIAIVGCVQVSRFARRSCGAPGMNEGCTGKRVLVIDTRAGGTSLTGGGGAGWIAITNHCPS
jgi:hypothetical protein